MSLSPDRPPELTPEEQRIRHAEPVNPSPEDWPALYAAGSSLARIAGLTGYPVLTIRQELQARGVTVRPPGTRCGSRLGLSRWHEIAAAMRARGYCYAAIGRELGQTPQAVRSALVRRAKLADYALLQPSTPCPHEPAP
ncbi:hypothetical protein E2C06_35245 [Dankookia rubra]|uniref:Helix-turn-helix domain-containing protein n=1 Tax=Dankookia rubra TaxID=1442381 RepID=A0A4R5Q4S0_9PROT|nr:hypothetical protein [Dankookia rubra]TDH57934.1 hypothetical protein E2C06_35245 [Dankookia rubra]